MKSYKSPFGGLNGANGAHMISGDKHFMSSDDLVDYVVDGFILNRVDIGLSTIARELKITMRSASDWQKFVIDLATTPGYNLQMVKRGAGIVSRDGMIFTFSENYAVTKIVIHGDESTVVQMERRILDKFSRIRCTVEWYYSTDGDSTTIPLDSGQLPVQEMYPWMQQDLESYYDEFIQSNSSILLLIGPPGTGKTTWIKGFLNHTETDAIVTYDPAILKKDYVFSQFISGDRDVMVIEDADTYLKSRADGNELMARFLNVGSGLVSNGKKKIIFSTNLPSVRDIDEALLRPGRCHDVLQFKCLNQSQAEKLSDKFNIEFKPNANYSSESESYTIAETMNQAVSRSTRGIGFI